MAQRLTTFLTSAIFAVALAGEGLAATCASLATELARLQSSSSRVDVGQAAQYQQEFARHVAALAQEQARARRANCMGGGFLFFRSRPQRACAQIIPRLRQLEARVAELNQLRRQASSGTQANEAKAQRIRSIMRQANCSANFRSTAFRNRGEFDEYFEGDGTLRDDYGIIRRAPGNTYRTLCVRSCDGYYFPISFSTTRDKFADDQESCQKICPGTKVELYYHPNPGGSSEEMVSMSGAPYGDHPSAFAYRQAVSASCTCGSSKAPMFSLTETRDQSAGTEVVTVRLAPAPSEPIAAESGTVDVPRARPGPGTDPETVANRAGGLEFDELARLARVHGDTARRTGGVRIVGPVKPGDPEEAAVVLVPVPN